MSVLLHIFCKHFCFILWGFFMLLLLDFFVAVVALLVSNSKNWYNTENATLACCQNENRDLYILVKL